MKRLLLTSILILCLAVPLHGAQTAKDTILAAIDEVISILRTGDYADPASKDSLAARLKPIMDETFDFKEMSMRTVGRPWQTFTEDQQDEFAGLFAQLLTETYIDRIRQYTDEKVEFIDQRTNQKGNVEIQTKVVTADKEIPIFYRMTHHGKWMVYDVLVEGVSLVKNYRTQFQEILVNGKPSDLIETMTKKVASLRTTGK
ncbi:MAG: ABC transporter substrate-binding protein [Desulfovibrionaceae bacterium]|jgi:phospholipid transport system substrate-binding protein|nr:ABC transporter substrate-binding protein [Desulfovibrionaceae bacterium]